jgi:restriction system protein
MKHFPSVASISPKDFELQVKAWLESGGSTLESFSAEHREQLAGTDGEYEIDVVARFKAFESAEFLMLVECKKHKNSIKRELVQALRQKQMSLGAHKGMLVSTSPFQSGARDFAKTHGIALVEIISGAAVYVQASAKHSVQPIPESAEDYAGIFHSPIEGRAPQPFTAKRNYGIGEFLEKV